MKAILIPLIGLATVAVAAAQSNAVTTFDLSQANKGLTGATMDARDNGGGTVKNAIMRKVEVSLGNSGQQPYDGTLDVIWIAKNRYAPMAHVHHRDVVPISMTGVSRDRKVLEMAPLMYNDFIGWVAMLRTEDKVTRLKTSNQKVDEFMKSPAFKKSLENYELRNGSR